MDIQRIISLVKETKGIITNREMAALVKEKRSSRLRYSSGCRRSGFLEEGITYTCAGHTVSRRGNRLTAYGYRQLLDS